VNRRAFLTLSVAAPALIAAPRALRAAAPRLEVAKSPTCGCCTAWVAHMQAAGFDARVYDMSDAALEAFKTQVGLPAGLRSCHTATVDGYVVEGHVPARDVRRLLAEQPAALGLSVPGMPVGSPGMEMGDRLDRYDVVLIGLDGAPSVFATYG
jgi:hypothetical protein